MKKFDVFFTVATCVEAESEETVDIEAAFKIAIQNGIKDGPWDHLEAIEELEEL